MKQVVHKLNQNYEATVAYWRNKLINAFLLFFTTNNIIAFWFPEMGNSIERKL